jgi:hypothetical protein
MTSISINKNISDERTDYDLERFSRVMEAYFTLITLRGAKIDQKLDDLERQIMYLATQARVELA